jgi:hypothetical protein
VNESAYVTEVIREELSAIGRDVVGPIELSPEGLSAYDRQLLLSVDVRTDPGYHPSIAHCHVIARIGRTTFSDPLDGCIMGIDADRRVGLAKAARSWVQNVGSVLFSMLHARPVMGAAHFGPDDPWGVAGCHGFAGPLFGYGIDESALRPLLAAPLFDFATAMAPPGLVHLAKAVLQGHDGGQWTRTLEIDGHAASHAESPWISVVPAPPNGIAARFALFHFGDQPGTVTDRKMLDDTIRRFVSAADTTTPEAAVAKLREGGVAPDLFWRVSTFLPIAFFRVVFGQMNLRLSPDYHRVGRDGQGTVLTLMREPTFARAIALAPELMAGGHAEGVKRLAMSSSTFNALNSALKAGSKPENLVFGAPAVADPGFGVRHVAPPPPPSKPWWRFW